MPIIRYVKISKNSPYELFNAGIATCIWACFSRSKSTSKCLIFKSTETSDTSILSGFRVHEASNNVRHIKKTICFIPFILGYLRTTRFFIVVLNIKFEICTRQNDVNLTLYIPTRNLVLMKISVEQLIFNDAN